MTKAIRPNWPWVFALVLVFGCVSVVVNVYFPESEARGALAALENEILGEVSVDSPTPGEAVEEPMPDPATTGSLSPTFSDNTAIETRTYSFSLVGVAEAADTEKDIYNSIKDMPDVVEAYGKMKARLARVNALRANGVVGEGNRGLLVFRQDKNALAKKDTRTVAEENRDRKKIIDGLALASLLAEGLEDTSANRNRFRAGAENTFAELRREKAQKGWWVQLPSGEWSQK